jgi:hypothetical protein|tara:strand:+ start:308 stop:517 length:210 start_codon:yes stop_codon:yes gene_type:complete
MKQITFSCRIVCDDNDGINGLHLCEEIQAYLNSNLSYYDDDLDENVNAEVTGYAVEVDKFVPFIAQEEY